MKKPEEKDYFLETGCGMEFIRLADFYDVDNDDTPKEVISWQLALSLMSYMHNRYPWLHKWRHIWYILKEGTPWKDEVILDLKTTKILRDRLTEMIARAESLLDNKEKANV